MTKFFLSTSNFKLLINTVILFFCRLINLKILLVNIPDLNL